MFSLLLHLLIMFITANDDTMLSDAVFAALHALLSMFSLNSVQFYGCVTLSQISDSSLFVYFIMYEVNYAAVVTFQKYDSQVIFVPVYNVG